ncbi:MAG: YbaB/EbfC family nucleoid-associated protein [Janthinobacterium lividum]
MNEAPDVELTELVEHYRVQYEELGRTQERLRAMSGTATAPRQVVTVTVGFGGAITDITFPNSGYKRMAPADLGKAILETVKKAQQLVTEEMATIMSPTMPGGLDVRDLVDGTADLRSLLPAAADGEELPRNVLAELLANRG